ncbi:kinase-like domain-containing protein [Rhodocollybia butyracea]|uniref:Kinase-like domain-containing protein n=1 Tax=Rhodocollybia butyracea TaxID=206335 RepID=A0A9P5UGK0_9AGAR|nr:kinase-like domain-containing protein [Rhodocollybia butyracea]
MYPGRSNDGETKTNVLSSDGHGKDGADNYDILEHIASNVASNVYRARCKRGRLKNRLVALKKTGLDKSHSPSSISLYQTLCHPCIVSLLSTFSTSSYRIQILELCSAGSLADFLADHQDGRLSEGQTRTVLKPILDGLAYLKKNHVVHRNINPENVLLTEHYRIKLSNLDLSIRLPTQDHTAITLLSRPEYTAPEFISRRPYDYSADIWSLGCIVFICLVGKPPFQGSSTDQLFENILHGRYTIPTTISALATNFVSSLIRVDANRRQNLSSISFDAFLDSRHPDTPLKRSVSVPQAGQIRTSKPQSIPFRAPSSFKTINEATGKTSRLPLREIQNADLRRILSDEISLGDRRVVSEPTKPVTVVDHGGRRHVSLNLSGNARSQVRGRPEIQSDLSGNARSQVRDRPEIQSDSESTEHEVDKLTDPGRNYRGLEEQRSDSESSTTQIPIGTTRPLPLNTSLLSARVHKTVNGQITILPSRSLLVDFREGERRRGKPGTEVFVVNHEGNEVEIYAAPHHDAPCCLTDSQSVYTIETLPREYWAQYNDARDLIDRLKQRTPRMTLHEPTMKCTLMANAPQADLEIMFSHLVTTTTNRLPQIASTDEDRAYMRLRYSRQKNSLEIAQYVSGPQGKEWKKRTLNISNLDLSSETRLSNVEIQSIKQLSQFMHVCETVEAAEKEEAGNEHDVTFRVPHDSGHSGSSPLAHPLLDSHSPILNRVVSGSRTLAQSFSMPSVDIKLAPRPPKISSISNESHGPLHRQSEEVDYPSKALSLTTSDITPWYLNPLCTTELVASAHALQTRFIPSIGWCIRYHSKVSQGGRYKVMFLDGEVLDVDVDEEWVEHAISDGDVTNKKQRHPIRESHLRRGLSERMKVFEDFVSMFDVEEAS